MTTSRFRVGLAAFAFGLVAFTGTATAQVAGCSFSDCTPQGEEVTTTTTAPPTTLPGGVLGEEVTTGAPGAVAPSAAPAPSAAAAESAPSGTLPFTGGDVAGLTIAGVGAVALGTLLMRRNRTQH
jgi:hypothetical protein